VRFRPNTVLRSSALNSLGELAERQSLQGAAAGTWNNGVGVVVRNPRRAQRHATSDTYAPPQWGCSVVADGESHALRVRSGSLGWGGAHVAVWPSGDAVDRAVYGDIALSVPVGELHYVIWYTTAAPVPLAACPKNPTQTTEPCAECDGCTVGAPGDPASFVPDRGNVGIVPTLDRQADWTDMRVLATVECTAEGVYRVVQIQTAEIAVHAIVYPGESGEGEAPTCGHPGNDLDDDHPGDGGGSGAGGSYYTPGGGTGHPGDDEGDNGATPECGGEATEFDPFGD
jgi:hypothetical protein